MTPVNTRSGNSTDTPSSSLPTAPPTTLVTPQDVNPSAASPPLLPTTTHPTEASTPYSDPTASPSLPVLTDTTPQSFNTTTAIPTSTSPNFDTNLLTSLIRSTLLELLQSPNFVLPTPIPTTTPLAPPPLSPIPPNASSPLYSAPLPPSSFSPPTERGRRDILPPRFSGVRRDDDTDVDGFLLQCEIYFKLTRSPDHEHVLLAVSRLSGIALSWWRGNRVCIPGLDSDWTTFSARLGQEFRPVDADRDARERLYALRDRNLTVQAIINEFTRQIPRILALPDKEILHLFLHCLPRDVRPFVLTQQPQTYAQAKSLASVAAAALAIPFRPNSRNPRASFSRTTPTVSTPPSVSSIEPTEDSIDAVPDGYTAALPGGYRHPPPLTKEERQRLLTSGGCFRCRQQGHQASSCPTYNDSGNGRRRE